VGAEESRDREGREAAVVSAGQTILGLDPGVRTGVAIYVLGRLQTLRTIPPDQIGSEIAAVFGLDGIVYQDSRQGTVWTTHRNPRAALLGTPWLGRDLAGQLQRCPGFAPLDRP